MHWLEELFIQPSSIQTLLVLAIIAAAGLALGKVKVYGISLGVTFVFFAGILAGHFGADVNEDMLLFAQNAGLIIFVYTLGLQVGPGFFSSFKKGGIKLNLLGMAVILCGFAIAIPISLIHKIPLTEMMGLFSGAVTNTPMLGAAQQAALQINPEDADTVTNMSLACAVTYPFGVIGMIAVIIILKKMNRKKPGQQTENSGPAKPFITEFQISNPAIFGKTIKEIMSLTSSKFVISRVWKNGKVSIPTSDTVIGPHDHLLVISGKTDIEKINALFGEKAVVDVPLIRPLRWHQSTASAYQASEETSVNTGDAAGSAEGEASCSEAEACPIAVWQPPKIRARANIDTKIIVIFFMGVLLFVSIILTSFQSVPAADAFPYTRGSGMLKAKLNHTLPGWSRFSSCLCYSAAWLMQRMAFRLRG